MKTEENEAIDDYGTDKYCTCEKHSYDSHTCPFKTEIYEDDVECCCCPYCVHECGMDI